MSTTFDRGKNNRIYEIQILPPGGELIVIKSASALGDPGFSAQFSVKRDTLASANKGNVTIFNLGPKTRWKLYKDRYTFAEYWQLVIKAGYGNRLERIFQGNIYECFSYQQGTEWITKIDAFDGLSGITNGFTSQSVDRNTDKKNIISSIIRDMPNVLEGALGGPTQGDPSSRGKVLLGPSSQVLSEETGGQYFIDNEMVNVLDDDEVLTDQVIILDSKQLFGTPRRRDTFLDCSILFLPKMQVGVICEVRSKERIYNGQYKVMGFSHDVTVSSATCGTATTKISLYTGAGGLRGVV